MKKLRFVTLLFVVCLSTAAVAQTTKTIDAYCKTVDALVKKHSGPELVFADTAGMDDDKEKWQKFASEKALDAFREKSETYSIAYNWLKGGKIVASNFTLFSGSGDWVKYVYHYFRTDGTLARVKSELRTFNGDFTVIRTYWFDAKGKLVHKTVQYLDLKTGKPKKHDEGVMGDDPKEIDYFKTTRKLPFAHLLKR